MREEAEETERRTLALVERLEGKKTAIQEKGRETKSEATEMMKIYLGGRAVRRFMPGETMESALDAAAPLQAAGIGTMYTKLGENLESLAEADAVADHYIAVLDAIQDRGLDRRDLGQAHPARAGHRRGPRAGPSHRASRPHAATTGSYVWIDMEGSAYTDATFAPVRAPPRRSSRARASACRPTSVERLPTSSACGRWTRPSAWSRAPTTSRRRSRSGTSARSTRATTTSPSRS